MGFWDGSCPDRWSILLRKKVTTNGARKLDIFVLAPVFVYAGLVFKKLPTLVRYGLVLVGVGLVLWNAFDVIDNGEKNDATDKKRSVKKKK